MHACATIFNDFGLQDLFRKSFFIVFLLLTTSCIVDLLTTGGIERKHDENHRHRSRGVRKCFAAVPLRTRASLFSFFVELLSSQSLKTSGSAKNT